MGTECSTFILSTWNCTAGRGRTGWNTGTLSNPEAFWEIKIKRDKMDQKHYPVPKSKPPSYTSS